MKRTGKWERPERREDMPAPSHSPFLADAGDGLVAIETCKAGREGCKRALIDVPEAVRNLKEWIRGKGLAENLPAWYRKGPRRYHNRFRIVFSGCPNACSRPQVADLGVIGFRRPMVDPADCRQCEACKDVCPDKAITLEYGSPWVDRASCKGCTKCKDICPASCIELSEPGYRLYAGGKLGRSPRLADLAGEFDDMESLIEKLNGLIDEYNDNAQDGERLADWLGRFGKEKE